MTRPTVIWGVAADGEGFVHHEHILRQDLGNGHYRAWKEHEVKREPADAYASSHPTPIPMRWHHGEDIGRIVSLRREGGRLLAVGESDLEPDDLQALTDDWGDLRWSTGTRGRRAPLVIGEISLTPAPASVGLWPVSWLVPGAGRGNLPSWVEEDLNRKVETRSRELTVHEIGGGVDDFTRSTDPFWNPYEIHHSGALGQVLSVEGRSVRR